MNKFESKSWDNSVEKISHTISAALGAQHPLTSLNDSQVMDIIDHSYDAIWITNAAGFVLKVTKAWAYHFNCVIEDVQGRHISEVSQFYQCVSATQQVLETGEPHTLINNLRNGITTLVSAVPIYAPNGMLQYVISNIRNITPDSGIITYINKYYQELQFLRAQVTQPTDRLVFESEAMQNILKTILLIKDLECTVLLLGDTGTGKTALAKYIHSKSIRSDQPLIEINCAAIPPQLLESELFGYEQGAFTGARKGGKPGMFELANRGTLVLDEIDSLPIQLQGKLLSVVQEHSVIRIGGNKRIALDVRLICICKPGLEKLVADGSFREDLFFRINVMPIEIPPLAQRKKDIRVIFNMYLEEYCKKYHRNTSVAPEAYEILENYSWPGNIRELRNLVERLLILNTNSMIYAKDIPCHENSHAEVKSSGLSMTEQVQQLEKQLLESALVTFGSTRKAAKYLGITQSALMRKKKKYGIVSAT